jgi:hypothetical protein
MKHLLTIVITLYSLSVLGQVNQENKKTMPISIWFNSGLKLSTNKLSNFPKIYFKTDGYGYSL